MDGTSEFRRVSTTQRALEDRVANPLLRWLLRSRVHWLASRWLVLVSYVGPRSGQRYTFPVAYHQVDGAIVAVTPSGESRWWRNFQEPRGCRVWLRGEERSAIGTVVTGEDRGSLLAAYVRQHELLGRMLGADLNGTPAQIADSNPDLAVVRFSFDR